MNIFTKTKKKFTTTFYGRGSTVSMLEPLRAKFPEIPGTHFMDLRSMKG